MHACFSLRCPACSRAAACARCRSTRAAAAPAAPGRCACGQDAQRDGPGTAVSADPHCMTCCTCRLLPPEPHHTAPCEQAGTRRRRLERALPGRPRLPRLRHHALQGRRDRSAGTHGGWVRCAGGGVGQEAGGAGGVQAGGRRTVPPPTPSTAACPQTTCRTRPGCAPLRSPRATPQPWRAPPPPCSGAGIQRLGEGCLRDAGDSRKAAVTAVGTARRYLPWPPPPARPSRSPYLKFGCLSPRLFHAKLAQVGGEGA